MADKSKRWIAVLRTLHQSRKLNRVSEGSELLYRRLLEVVDDNGNYDADPAVILGQVFAHRMAQGLTVQSIMERTQELVKEDLVWLYRNNELLHISNHYTKLRADGHGTTILYEEPSEDEVALHRTPNGDQLVTDRTPQTRHRLDIDKTKTIPDTSDSASPKSPSDDNPPAPKPRSFRERLVDGCLLAFEKRYCLTRGVTEYPGGLAALRESGFGVVTKRLKTLCPEVPYTNAGEASKTPEQLEELAKEALKIWGGYLDRAVKIHDVAKGIPGKDGDWLRFPETVAKFCGRIPKLTDADVNAAGKRAADVSEARKNSKRMNPEQGSTIRYGQLNEVCK